MRQVREEADDEQDVCPHEDPLARLGPVAFAEDLGDRVRDRRPGGGPLVQAGGDQRRMPEQQRQHDQRDQPEDEVGLAEVAAPEPLRPLHLADPERGGDADEDEHDEEVDEECEPALRSEPRQRLALRDCADQRHHDRREQHQEAPEDERMDEAGAEALEQLLLAENDDRLVAHPLGHVVEALHRLAEPDEPGEKERPAAEQGARDAEDERGGRAAETVVLTVPKRPGATGAFRAPAPPPQLRRHRRHHLVQIPDHRVVGDRHDRRLGVGVDGQDPLRALGARDVLGRPGHTACDVDLRRDLVPRLPHLIGVWTPARHRHRPRAADGAAEQPCELLDHGEALRRADATATGDDDLRVGERHPARRRRHVVAHAHDEVCFGQLRRERLHRTGRARPNRRDRVRCDRQQRPPGVELGLLEQAPTPAKPRQRERRARA